MGCKHENVWWSASHGEMSVICRYSRSAHTKQQKENKELRLIACSNFYRRWLSSLSETENKCSLSCSVTCGDWGRSTLVWKNVVNRIFGQKWLRLILGLSSVCPFISHIDIQEFPQSFRVFIRKFLVSHTVRYFWSGKTWINFWLDLVIKDRSNDLLQPFQESTFEYFVTYCQSRKEVFPAADDELLSISTWYFTVGTEVV